MPCKLGTRESVEASKRWYREERERDATDPYRKLWRNLVNRVHRSSDGFSGLSEAEQLYFAVVLLDGEVHNGGFDQFFFNSSGTYFAEAQRGLAELGADTCLKLLERAKAVIFGSQAVPLDTEERRCILRGRDARLLAREPETVDQAFWSDPDAFASRLEKFAKDRRLVDEAAQQGDEADEA